jgi:dTDP-4-dehydrorhamnose reductase
MTIFVIGANGSLARKVCVSMKTCLPIRLVSSAPADPFTLKLDLRAPGEFDYDIVAAGDKVVFAAAISSPDQCQRQFDLAYAINVTGTIEAIANFIDRGARVIFFSSDVVFGETAQEVLEDSDRRPSGPYAEMKSAVERYFEDMPQVKTLRLSYVLSGSDTFLAYLRACLERGTAASAYHALDRRVVAIDDLMTAIEVICRDWGALPFPSLNVAGPDLLSRRQLADIYAEATGSRLRVASTEPPPGFFDARPRVINMGSRYLEKILKRPPATAASTIAALVSDQLPGTQAGCAT